MTKSSTSRVNRKGARQNVAKTALQLLSQAKPLPAIVVDGKLMEVVALPKSAHDIILAGLASLARS